MLKFYKCTTCGNEILMVKDSGVNPICCGKPMQELIANTIDAAKEKHVPVISYKDKDIVVDVGSVKHPMLKEHYIEWIALETDKGVKIQYLKPDDKPTACFCLTCNEKFIAAYAYCNLHGLWKVDNMKSKANQTDYKDWPDYINI